MASRFPLLAYQSGIWEYTTPEETPLIIVASMIRVYYVVLLLVPLFVAFSSFFVQECCIYILFFRITSLAFERECALYYVKDYEQHHRPWIPVINILWSVFSASFSSVVYTFNFISIEAGATILAVIAAIAFMVRENLYSFLLC